MQPTRLQEDLFEGVISFRRGEEWLQPLRLRADEIPLHNEGFAGHAETTGGCRLRFATDSRRVALAVEPDPNGDGYEVLGRNFAEKVIDRMELKA